MPPRIAHVSATFPPYYAGTGNMCRQSARLSAAAGYDVTVYTARVGSEPDQTQAGVKVRRLAAQFRVGNAAFLGQLLAMPRYDLVHLHYPFILGAELIWLKHLLTGQRYVLSYHNDLVWDGLKGFLFRLYQALWARLVLLGAERVIVSTSDFVSTSPQLRQVMLAAADRIVEIPNGVDADIFRPNLDGGEVRQRQAIGRASPVVVFVGAMDTAHHVKGGVPVLLQALAQLADPRVTLLLVGGGDRVPAYAALARQLGVAEQTRFVGWVAHDTLAPYYAAADVVVLPSVRTEAFGMVVIEALACGRPVIASNLPGVRSVVRVSGGGVLVAPGDPRALAQTIADLLAHPAKRLALSEQGRRAVERLYAWPVVSTRLNAVYQDVLSAA